MCLINKDIDKFIGETYEPSNYADNWYTIPGPNYLSPSQTLVVDWQGCQY